MNVNMNEEKAEAARRQGRIEQGFSNLANMHHEHDPLPEVIGLLRNLFDYMKAIDDRQLALLARKSAQEPEE